jgi:hypothetical protein
MAFITPPDYLDAGISYIPYDSELSIGSGPRSHEEIVLFNAFDARVGTPQISAFLVALEAKDGTTICVVKSTISSITNSGFKLTTLTDNDS